MLVQAYAAYPGIVTITVATLRPEAAGSAIFTAASIHEDFAAKVRKVMKEHKHIGDTALAWPVAQRIQTYFPTFGGNPIYAIRQLLPAGSPRDIDDRYMLEIMRIRYQFMLNILPAGFAASEEIESGMERNIEKAIHDLFQANGVPDAYIPGDMGIRPEGNQLVTERSEIDIICEMGVAEGRRGLEIAAPTS